MGTASLGTGLAAGVCLGKVEGLNKAASSCWNHTTGSGGKFFSKTGENLNGIANGLPVVGHIKGEFTMLSVIEREGIQTEQQLIEAST